jgi:hypothetical protein
MMRRVFVSLSLRFNWCSNVIAAEYMQHLKVLHLIAAADILDKFVQNMLQKIFCSILAASLWF